MVMRIGKLLRFHSLTHYSLRRGRRAGDVGGRAVNGGLKFGYVYIFFGKSLTAVTCLPVCAGS